MVPDGPDDVAGARALLAGSGLFDAAFYLAEYPDVRAGGGDPLDHFCHYGWREDRNPNAYFDTRWYLRGNPDIAEDGRNPLVQYALTGEAEGRPPCGRFDPTWYRRFIGLTAGQSALAHFLARCGKNAALPAAFDAEWYLAQYTDVAAAGVNPFAHYILEGAAEGRAVASDLKAIDASGMFDPSYYLIGSPDVGEGGGDPLAHFCVFGWREGRRPNAYFDPLWYRQRHIIELRQPTNPLVHYVRYGEAADLPPCAYFDPAWYRRTYALPPGASPLLHYLRHRRSQRFSPNPLFDHAFYLRTYPDLIGPNRDPFAHFLIYGTRQDLDPSPHFNAAAYRREHMARRGTPGAPPTSIEDENPLVHFLLRHATTAS